MPELLEDELDRELAALPRETPTVSEAAIDAELSALPKESPTTSVEQIDKELGALTGEVFYNTEAEAKAAGHTSPWRSLRLGNTVWYANKDAARASTEAALGRGMKSYHEAFASPLKLRYENPQTFLQGAANAPLSLGEFLTSPEGITAALSGPLAGPAAARGVAGYYLADMASHVPQQIVEGVKAIRSGKPGPIGETAAGAVATPLFMRGLYKGATRPIRPIEPAAPIERAERPVTDFELGVAKPALELVTEPAAPGLKATPEPFPIETTDLADKKVYGPGGEAGVVTWSGIGIVEVNTGEGVKTWRKADLDVDRLFSDYPEIKQPVSKVELAKEERAPDIIDAIQATVGNERVINGREMHALDQNFPKNGFELNRSGYPKWFKKLFYYPKEGEPKRGHPQDVLNALQREGMFTDVADTADAFVDELFKAFNVRKSGQKVLTKEQELIEKQAAEVEAAERAAKIVEVKFENEERQAIAEAEKLGTKARVVDELPADPDTPFARAIPRSQTVATIAPDGTVLLNRPVLNRFLSAIEQGDRADAIRALVHEEVVHDAVRRLTGDQGAEAFFDASTALEQRLATRRYGGPAEGRPELSKAQIGHEMIRARIQQLAGMTPREVYGLRGLERLTVQTILILERAIAAVRRALGTKASKEQADMLDRVQRNLDAAKDSAVRAGEAPAALFRGGLPLEEGKPGEPRPTAAELGARRAPQITPAVVAEQFERHWTTQGRPSFSAFAEELRKLEPDVQPGQLREAWTDAVWDRLLKAPGAELERLRTTLGLEGRTRKELQSRAPVPDPVPPEQTALEARGAQVRQEPTALGFSVEREVPVARTERALKTGIREYTIARIGEKLIGEAQEGRPSLRRTEVKPDEIGWWRADDARHPSGDAYRRISLEESQNAATLGKLLTQGAAVTRPTRRVDVVGGQPVVTKLKATSPTVSKRVTAVLNNRTGAVDLLGTFDDHGAMIGDPLRAGRERPNVSLASLLERKDAQGRPLYRVLDSYLLDEPVQNFRQRFESFKDYREGLRDEVAARAAEHERGLPTFEEGREIEQGETPRSMRVPTQPTEARGAIEMGGPITDAEAGSMLDHLYDTVGRLDSVEDVKLSFQELSEKPNWQVISGYSKLYDAIRKANPDLSAEAALDKLVNDVYETAQTAPNREAFVARTMGRAQAEAPGAVRGSEAQTQRAAQLEPLAAFWRDQAEKGKHLAEQFILEPARLYSEWMVDRLERAGGRLTKSFAQTARRIIDRQKQLYGDLTPTLDPARKEAGKAGRATTWFNSFSEKPTPDSAIRNAAPALEGTIQVPGFAKKLRDLADVANRAIGQLYVGISGLTAAGGKFQRNITAYGYDVIRRGHGMVWNRWINGLAAANRLNPGDVKNFFEKWKEILDDPASDATAFEKVNQDFARVFPKAITDVRDVFGAWQPVVHADLFNYLENTAQRASHTRAFREVFPATAAGQAALERAMQAIRKDTPGEVQPALEGLMRALNGHPTDNYSNAGLLHPSSGVGAAFRWFNQTAGNLAARAVLSGQMLTQVGETAVGATPQFLGTRRYLRALAGARQVWGQLEREGKRNAVIYDWSFDPNSPIRSASKIGANALSKGFAENFLNEVQEGAAAATAKIVTDDIRTGNLSGWDKRVLPETFKAMGFSKTQAADMLAGRAPHLLEQFERRAAAFLTGGNKAIAEGSRVGANRLVNSVFRFQSYPMMKMNQLRKVVSGFTEAMRSGTPREKIASAELLGRFLFGSTLQGALTLGIVALFTEGLSGLMVRKQEAEDQPIKFLLESGISTMSGPLYLLFRGGRDKGIKGYGEQAQRMFFPYAVLSDLNDMAYGFGPYEKLDRWQRLGRFVQQKTPGTKAIRVALATVGLAQVDLKTEAAIRGYKRWIREQPGYREAGDLLHEGERAQFRKAMNKAMLALQNGDAEAYQEARAEAVGEARALPDREKAKQRVAASMMARRILFDPERKYYFKENGLPDNPEALSKLESRIGADALQRLRYYDKMIEQQAEALNPSAR